MARYTVELNTLLKDERVSPLIDKALSTYPMYDPISKNEEVLAIIPTREGLNKRLLNHYKYREIGFETVGMFLDKLEITMNEIMPYYNQMFNTVEIMANLENPFDNVDIVETFNESRTGNRKENDTATNETKTNDSSETTANVESTSKNVRSQTPQNELSITAKNIDSVGYADEVNWTKNGSTDNGTTSGESSSNSTTTDTRNSDTKEDTEHTFTKKGNQGVNTYAHDMIEFRTSIIDVVNMIIDDKRVKSLFMQIF